MTSVLQTDELLSLMNNFSRFAPQNITQSYFDEFSKIQYPWVFPGKLLGGMSNYFDNQRPTVRNPECWNKLFTDIISRFTRLKNELKNRTGLHPELKHALEHAEKYTTFLDESLRSGRIELFPVLERWGVNTLHTLSLMIKDNVLIAGAGPIGLITVYFLKMSIPSLKIVVTDIRAEYTRDYHVLLSEDSFDSLPYEIQTAIWGAGKYGCYVLPPPIDANGYCFLNPPNQTEIPGHLYAGWYPDNMFDVNHRTGKKTLKKLMSIPIRVFEKNMYDLIRRRFPDVSFIKPRSDQPEDKIVPHVPATGTSSNGFNRIEFWTNNNKLIAKNVFSNDFMYNFYIDASGASPDNIDPYFDRTDSTYYTSNKTDLGMTIVISHDPQVTGTIKEYMNDKTVDLRPAQDNSRLFTPNQSYPNLLLSVRNLPSVQKLLQGDISWHNLHIETQEHIKKIYSDYFHKELDPTKITKLNMFIVRLGQAKNMYTESNFGVSDTKFYGFLLGDSACAVHYFSGTGINNGIKMATKLTELLSKAYQSRWKYDLSHMFRQWETDMKTLCTKTLQQSEHMVQ